MKSINQFSQIIADKISKSNVEQMSKEIWWTLIRQKQYGKLDQLLDQVDEKIAKSQNMLRAVVICADEPSPDNIERIKAKLEKKFTKKIQMEIKVDPNLLGGFKILVDDTTIDLSYKTKLSQLKTKLAGVNE